MARSALIIGATGLIGRLILPELISNTSPFSRVGEFGRRVTPGFVADEQRLLQKTIDFDKIEEAGLKGGTWDVVYIAYVPLSSHHGLSAHGIMGRLDTKKALAGSKEAFIKIDKE